MGSQQQSKSEPLSTTQQKALVENTPLLQPNVRPPHHPSSTTPQQHVNNNSTLGEVRNLLERYQRLFTLETQLVQKLRTCDFSSSPTQMKNLGIELHTVLNQKMQELQSIVGDDSHQQILSAVKPINGVPSFAPAAPSTVCVSTTPLVVEEQPSGNVVANKYLEPPLVIRVDNSVISLAREGKLQVSAALCVTLSDEIISRTLDNKQDILQGHTVVPVSAEGYATFNKLKIMEVSSKHHHQSFSIQLQLQEIRKAVSGAMVVTAIGEAAKSAPLHVQSRINKRKRSSFHVKPKKRARGEADCNYVDITSLLVLPQKEAATRLGISESMLCKRFKECTRRKWPYRYLRKIDKMIRVLTLNKKGDSIPKEDQEKIQKLKREREECLHPVKIRITGHDKTAPITAAIASRRGSTFPATTPDDPAKLSDSDSEEMSSNSSPYDEEDEEDDEGEVEEVVEDDDEIAQVASTLNLLKQGETLWNQ